MIGKVQELLKYRDLLYMITWKDIRVKYKQSVMGFLWAILMPALIVLTGVLVRLAIARFSGVPLQMSQIVSVSVKSVPWAFLVSSIRFSTNSLVQNSNLISRIYFPREVIPISAVLSQFFDFLIASCVLVVIVLSTRTGLSIHLLYLFPLLAALVLFSIALGIILSAANLFFRDVKYLVEVFTSFAIFITPVYYEAKLFGKWQWLIYLNPVAPVLEGLNDVVVLHQQPKLGWLAYSLVLSLLGLYVSFVVFKRLEPRLAENV